MTDRLRLDPIGRPANGQAGGGESTPPTTGPDDSAGLGDILSLVFSQVSKQIAGDSHSPLPPLGATDAEAERFTPQGPDALDPDGLEFADEDLEEFTPDFTSVDIPPGAPSTPFDPSTLPEPGDGRFVRTKSGLLRYTTGIGEAPNNKANWRNPAYVQRAEFMSGVLDFLTSSFDARSAGQHRDHGAKLTSGRSANSDHYSGGAVDVRASSPAEAQRILVWASQQPWVSFAQLYPDSTLVHISANIGVFGGNTGPASVEASFETEPSPTPSPSPSPSGASSRLESERRVGRSSPPPMRPTGPR